MVSEALPPSPPTGAAQDERRVAVKQSAHGPKSVFWKSHCYPSDVGVAESAPTTGGDHDGLSSLDIDQDVEYQQSCKCQRSAASDQRPAANGPQKEHACALSVVSVPRHRNIRFTMCERQRGVAPCHKKTFCTHRTTQKWSETSSGQQKFVIVFASFILRNLMPAELREGREKASSFDGDDPDEPEEEAEGSQEQHTKKSPLPACQQGDSQTDTETSSTTTLVNKEKRARLRINILCPIRRGRRSKEDTTPPIPRHPIPPPTSHLPSRPIPFNRIPSHPVHPMPFNHIPSHLTLCRERCVLFRNLTPVGKRTGTRTRERGREGQDTNRKRRRRRT